MLRLWCRCCVPFCFALGFACSGQALELPASSKQIARTTEANTSFQLPIGPYKLNQVETLAIEGRKRVTIWLVPSNLTSFDVAESLRDQLLQSGFEVLFECETRLCGGFDFRFGIEVTPPPEMRVDLRDFRYFSAAIKQEAAAQHIGVLVSKTPLGIFVQIIEISAGTIVSEVAEPSQSATTSLRPTPISAPLSGTKVLEGLVFEIGSSVLAQDPLKSVESLAQFLKTSPDINVILVGHSDMSGSLQGNIRLSKQRAQSVRKILIDKHAIAHRRLATDGVGYLSPRASNTTVEGRHLNRRVEAIINVQ